MHKLLFVLLLMPIHLWAQKTTGEKALVITKMAAKYHVEPKPVNDSFSLAVYHAVLDKLDPYHIFLSSDDVQQLSAFKLGIDEEIQQQSTRFVQAAGTVLSKALLRSEQTAQSLLQKPFGFSVKEYFPLKLANGAGIPAAQLRPRLQLYLKWRMLQQLSEVWMDDSVGISQEILTKVDTVLRKEMSEKLAKKWKQFATDTAQFNNWIAATYLNVIATTYDPHTEYMSSEDKYALDEELSSESMEFGFGLDVDEEGNYKIDDVVPGSAAWKSSNIHEGDQIIAIKPEGGASISLRDASPEQIAEVLNKYADKSVEFTVKSADGTIRTVKLNKQPIRNEENVVRGWILEGDKKIGIISLPSFYTQMDNGTGTSCAEDMAREIVKLKQEKIDGLIVDLRFNGGGSLEEAAAMLGIFVDIGPLGMIKLYDGSFETIKDVNRGFIYDGPLVIMVNGASASASEILAGTLQDYRKAIIAGSTTFGKATMQVVLPLDSTLDLLKYAASKPGEPDPLQDYLKITIGKLYRVNGSTAQNIGVVPEVYLPDFFEAVDYTERSYPTSLKADSVPSKLVYRASPQKVSKTVLEDFEKASVQTDPEFIETQRLNRMQKLTNLAKQIPLKLAEYNEWYSSGYSDKSEMVADKKQENVAPFKVRNTRQDADYNAMDSFQKENDETIIQELTDDASIKQVYLLIKKMLETIK